MQSESEVSGNSGVPYVPVEEIPIEWRPPEHSPRLMSWAPLPNWFTWLSHGLGEENAPLAVALTETTNRLALCSQRLRESYLGWFEPMGPAGTHAHVHYRSPQDPTRRSQLQSAMVVDYEAYLVFLDVALDLVARAIGIHSGAREMSWRQLLRDAEKPDGQRPSWLPDDSARAARQLQRTALYARNKAIVHPNLHYVGLRTDNVGNVTYLRIPASQPSAEDLAKLDALWRSKYDVRDSVVIGEDPQGWLVVQMLDRISGDLDGVERKQLEGARDAVGFALPSVPTITRDLEALLAGICTALAEAASGKELAKR